jgi:hypothetical protein
MLSTRLSAAAKLLGLLAATGTLIMATAGCGSSSTLLIENVDGAAVSVVPWAGGPTVVVGCHAASDVNTTAAPSQPWLVTVRGLADHHLLIQQKGSGDVEVIVRRDGVLIGPDAPSVGPAGAGCTGT